MLHTRIRSSEWFQEDHLILVLQIFHGVIHM